MTERECSNCMFREELASSYPCSACNTTRPGVFGEDHWAPADLDKVIAERDAALARVAELEGQLEMIRSIREMGQEFLT